ncbi:hypothetical protein M433DRAFT_62443 [Acidomyces richmondensis BFW]|nr:MAG: hypothetical protein FE78DRAFT_140426 [Acidomyces sp. 'richmondensis']KYG47778.1 hypothetical protein M433DRAFT_62443 [Acidomyces richmondensis BFW]
MGRTSGFLSTTIGQTSARHNFRSQWICAECRSKVPFPVALRTLSSTTGRLREDSPSKKTAWATPTSREAYETPASPFQTLPSHAEQKRWQLSKDTTKLIDGILARASIAGQHINAYTGTDYTGIEALKKEIIAQEEKVKNSHVAVQEAKRSHDEAFNKQSSAQKEIVGLLERKSSWSPADLERYMSLVRSEHVLDQAVQAAKDSLATAERNLEDARSLLERLERKQYHEEQIWSDTIRRNSTWVTFGLMGLNVVLLLAQILIFEPHRRRRIVHDVKLALDEKSVSTSLPQPVKEEESTEPARILGVSDEHIQLDKEAEEGVVEMNEIPEQISMSNGAVLPEEAADAAKSGVVPVDQHPEDMPTAWSRKMYKEVFQDLFSERIIQIKQVELTTVALQGVAGGAATGIAAMGVLFFLLRSR